MKDCRKKSKLTDYRCTVSTTSGGEKLKNLLSWLKNRGTKGLEDGRFHFKGSDGQCGGSLGAFAVKDYAVSDVLFSIPLTCIISLSNAKETQITKLVREAAKAFGESTLVTSELLIWLFMIQQYADIDSQFSPFIQSLDSQSPSPLSWPKELLIALKGTNISTMSNSVSSIERHALFLDEVRGWALKTNRDCSFLGSETFNLTSLLWARGHYLARRYPGKFSICHDESSSLNKSGSNKNSSGGDDDSDTNSDGREQGMQNLGALVPLLDILNHDPEREWLTFEVLNGYLHVTCNHPITKGSELFSNYGSLSNEMLLYAYGFCLENNKDDALTLQLMGSDSCEGQKLETESEIKTDRAIGNPPGSSLPSTEDNSAPSSSTRHLGTYYVRSGGMAGIPNELWKRLSSLIDGVGEDEGKERNEGDHSLDASDGTAGVKNKIDPDLNQENDTEDEKDEDEEEEPVIVGIEECILLKDCIEKKLLLLRSTHQSACKILESFPDPRSLYIKWYRDGQMRIAVETLHSLLDVVAAATEENYGEDDDENVDE